MPPKTKWENGIIYIFATLAECPTAYIHLGCITTLYMAARYVQNNNKRGPLSNMMPLF